MSNACTMCWEKSCGGKSRRKETVGVAQAYAGEYQDFKKQDVGGMNWIDLAQIRTCGMLL